MNGVGNAQKVKLLGFSPFPRRDSVAVHEYGLFLSLKVL